MLDYFTIISKGGIVIWHTRPLRSEDHVSLAQVVDSFIDMWLRRGQVPEEKFLIDQKTVEWTTRSDLDLIFVVSISYASQGILALINHYKNI